MGCGRTVTVITGPEGWEFGKCLWQGHGTITSHCPELAKPGTQAPVLTELAVSQSPGAGGSWDDSEDTHGSVVVSSSEKQQAGMTNKLASIEPKASRCTTETEKRSEAPKTQLAASPSWCRLVLEVPLLGVTHSGEPHIKASTSL